jgi:hypothetical protein
VSVVVTSVTKVSLRKYRSIYREKSGPKIRGYSGSSKTAQRKQPPNIRKFTQSGHTGCGPSRVGRQASLQRNCLNFKTGLLQAGLTVVECGGYFFIDVAIKSQKTLPNVLNVELHLVLT